MKQVKSVALIAAMMICALAGAAFADDSPASSFIVEEYGFRVHLPNEGWTFEKPLAYDIKAQLKHSQDPVQLRLQAFENMKNHTERKLIEEYEKYQRKFDRSISFDKNITTATVNNRTWFIVNGTKGGAPFSIHFNRDRENVFSVTFEASSQELFQKYTADRDAFLAKIDFGAAPVKRFSDFAALEIEVVPTENARLDLEDITTLAGEIKEGLPPGVFKEVRAGRSATTENTLLLTLQVKFFKRGSRAKRYIIGFGAGKSALDGDLVFTDKGTGKVIYTNQVSHETTGGIFGGSSFDGVGDQVADIVKRKK